jgi:drug/metabolite transporter (DMT)-like permease
MRGSFDRGLAAAVSAKHVRLPGVSDSNQRTSGTVDWVGLGAALITIGLWSSAFVGIRAAGEDISPGPLAFGRLIIGAVLLGTLAFVRRGPLPRGRDLALVVGTGVIWFAGYNLSLNAAEQVVDAGTAAMLVFIGPLLVILLAGVFLGEGFPRRVVLGAMVAFAGILTIGLAVAGAEGGPDPTWGIVLCLLAALTAAIGVTLEKPVLGRISALNVTALACAVGAIVTAPFASSLVAELAVAAPNSVAWLVYLGVFPTSVAFTTWAFALNRTTAGRLATTMYLIPPTTIFLAWAILGEVPPLVAIVGGALSVAGVVIAQSRAKPAPAFLPEATQEAG